MHSRHIISAAALFACFATVAAAQPLAATNAPAGVETLSLTDAITRALDNNRDIILARFQAQSSAFNITANEAEFDWRLSPQVAAGAGSASDSTGYGLTAARKISWGTDISAGVDVVNTSPDEASSTSRGRLFIRLDQPLFRDAGPLVQLESIRQAQSGLQQALRQLEATRADVVLEVVARHADILRLERLVEADRQRLARLTQLQRLTTLREKQGRETRLDVLRVDLQHGQARTDVTAHVEQLETSRRAFADLLGDPPDRVFALTPAPTLAFSIPTPDDAAATALSNRLDYAQVLQDSVDAKRGKRIAHRRLWPDLRLSTRVERFGTGPDEQDAYGFDDTLWLIGLSGDSDLFRRRDRAAYQSADVAESSALLQNEIVRDRIVREVRDTLSAYTRAQSESEIAAQNLAIARQRLDLAQRLFVRGRTDNISVTDAETAYLLAQNDENTAAAEASVSGYRVLRSLGTLIEAPAELKPVASL